MKRLNLSLLIFCFTIAAYAQEITVIQDTVERAAIKQKYKYQSFDQYDQNLLFKLGAIGSSNLGILGDLPFDLLAVEYLFTKRLSIGSTYYFPSFESTALSFSLRYYLKGGRLAENMSGKYFGLEYSNVFNGSTTFDTYLGFDKALFFQFGQQIKKSRFGYADFRLFTSYQFGSAVFSSNRSFKLGLNVNVGAAWGPSGNRTTTQLPANTGFSARNEHFLITLENPQLIFGDRFRAVGLATTLEKELLIKGLTGRATIGTGYSKQTGFEDAFLEATEFAVSISIRKYFGLLGRSNADDLIRSFVGLYASAGVNSLYSFRVLDSSFLNGPINETQSGSERAVPFLSVGYQERLGKRYFYDIFALYSFHTNNSFVFNTRGPASLSFGTRVGLNWSK